MTARAGIRASGAYLPRQRLERAAIAAATGWATGARAARARGERTACNWDEDSVTMAVEAARDCLGDLDRRTISSLSLASTTLPFADRCNAGIAATALDLDEGAAIADVASCQRAGTIALLQALERAPATSGDSLVVAADRRSAKPGSEQEMNSGHGAAAMLVGRGPGVAAELLGHATMHADFVDHYRGNFAPFDYALEERWVRDQGYLEFVPRTVVRALSQAGADAADVRHFVAQGPRRFTAAAARIAGIPDAAVVDDLYANCGDTGAAHPLLLLAAALENAGPGELVVLVGFGQGCDALVFRVTDHARPPAAGRGLSGALAHGVVEREYLRFLANCGIVAMDWGQRAERDNRTAHAAAWRRHREVTAFIGGRCSACGTVQFPKSQACVNPDCRAFHVLEEHPLAECSARVKTFTEDWLAFTRSPPLVYGNASFEGGGSVYVEFADTGPGELSVGAPLRFVFRVKDFDELRGFRRYAWKATPVRR